jgi:hypothetical protein
MQEEHAGAGKHVLRLLRRADRAATMAGTANNAILDSMLQAEVALSHPTLQPCGGAVFVQLTAPAAMLNDGFDSSSSGNSSSPTATAGSIVASDQQTQQFLALARQLLCCPGGTAGNGCSAGMLTPVVVKGAKPEDVALHYNRPALTPFSAPPANSTLKVHQYVRLEPLVEHAADGCQRRPRDERRHVAAMLHAHKMAPHLVLRFSCSLQSSKRQAGSSQRAKDSRPDSGSWEPADLVQRIGSYCQQLNASVVAVDAQLHEERADATLCLYVTGLAGMDSGILATALKHHFE